MTLSKFLIIVCPIIGFYIVCLKLLLWIGESFPLSEEEQKEEEPPQEVPDDTKKQDNIRALRKIANHSSEKTAKSLHHILTALEYLEEHGADMDRLHSYYLPEMISILHRCKKLKASGLTDKKTVKDMEDRAILAVTKVVDVMVEDIVKKEMSGIEIDTDVIEKASLYQLGIENQHIHS